ncbi:MAG: hypothetical protein K8R49_01045 [Candidatus Cloacimonetes bacterium]|nr:hypothetical protein [Candidatus Cloacimonadota bacterium]
MKISQFFSCIKTPLVIVCVILIFFTFFSFFIIDNIVLIEESSLLKFLFIHILFQLDLRMEDNVALWFVSIIILICGFAFFILGRKDMKLPIDNLQKFILKIISIYFLFLSMNKVIPLQESIWNKILTEIFEKGILFYAGISWSYIFFILKIIFFVFLILTFRKLLVHINSKKIKAKIYFLIFSGAFPLIIILKAFEIQSILYGYPQTILSCFIEFLGLTAFLSLFLLLNFIIGYYESQETGLEDKS